MTIIDSIQLSLSVLRANKVRSFLTSIGIIIGISAVIIIMSVGAGAQSLIINQLNSVGTNLIAILPGAAEENGPPASVFGIVVTTLTLDDALAIGREVKNIEAVSGYNSGIGTMTYQGKTTDATFYGVTGDYPVVEDVDLELGRFFSPEEGTSINRVVVLGYQVWQDLFDSQDPVGRKIKIKKESFEVIGVLEERGTAGFQSQDNQVMIPIVTAQKIMLGVRHVSFIRAKVNDPDGIGQASDEIKLLLRDRHDIRDASEDDFSVRNTLDAISTLTAITDALKFFLAAIAAISLVVGGVGVMNIMLASVNERIKEVGLRKSVGARRSHIMTQFVLETIAITVIGGIIGIMFGALISAGVALIANYLGYKWDLVITFNSIVLGVGVAAIVGLIFGIYPARKAASLDPIDALRYE
jgi:putative ABC transport system permease protein